MVFERAALAVVVHDVLSGVVGSGLSRDGHGGRGRGWGAKCARFKMLKTMTFGLDVTVVIAFVVVVFGFRRKETCLE